MMDAWRDLSDRERILIAVAGVLAVLFVVLQFVIAPMSDWRRDQTRKLRGAESLYEIVAEAAAFAGGGRASNGAAKAGAPIRNAVTDSANAAGVNINFVNARPDGSIETSAPSANPDRVYAWLEMLRDDYGVFVAYADIARDEGGVNTVRARFVFLREDAG